MHISRPLSVYKYLILFALSKKLEKYSVSLCQLIHSILPISLTLSYHTKSAQSFTMAPSAVEIYPVSTIYDTKIKTQCIVSHATAPAKLIHAPMKLSGALDKFESFDLTPCLGKEFPKANLAEWLQASNAEALIRDLAVTGMHALVVHPSEDNNLNSVSARSSLLPCSRRPHQRPAEAAVPNDGRTHWKARGFNYTCPSYFQQVIPVQQR